MYTVAVTRDFIANHYLIGGDWGSENQPHAHHYVAEVIVAIEANLDAIVSRFRDVLLNDLAEFAGLNPSIEHFSRIITEQLLAAINPPGSGALRVKLWENATCWAAFRQEF